MCSSDLLNAGRPGVVLSNSSVHQIVPKPGYLAYSLSKGAMGNFTATLALEYADRGIRVNAVGPGAIETPLNRGWTGDPEKRRAVEAHGGALSARTREGGGLVLCFELPLPSRHGDTRAA